MQFKKSVGVGVLITLYLSTDSLCHYIPEKKNLQPHKKNDNPSHSVPSPNSRIRICGNQLTDLILQACDGFVGSPHEVNSTKGTIRKKITEECCDHYCSPEILQTYCGENPIFKTRRPGRGKLLNALDPESQQSRTVSNVNVKQKGRKNYQTGQEVRIKVKPFNKKVGSKGRKKRKRSFKWKCAFKSFGHYLLTMDRNVRVRNNITKRHNSISRTWPSIQVGTISPEIEKFGGEPIVVIKKNKSSSV